MKYNYHNTLTTQVGALPTRSFYVPFAELFINGGATTATNLVYNSQNADGIVFETDGECTLSFTKYDIVVD